MIRPCGTCNGSGTVTRECDNPACGGKHGLDFFDCRSCVDMPQLRKGEWNLSAEFVWPDPFRPDPSTVMRWCLTHNCAHPALSENSLGWCFVYDEIDDAKPCRWGWVAAITEADVLEEA